MLDNYLHEIASAYAALPDPDQLCSRADALLDWTELGHDSKQRAAGIRLLLNVTETDEPEPYADAVEMCQHISEGGFYVSTANSEHPLWDVETNTAFRIVHDVLGHYAASVASPGLPLSTVTGQRFDPPKPLGRVAGFDWSGENRACAAHVPLLTHRARRALFTECIAQTAYAIDRGHFGPQKIGHTHYTFEWSELPGGLAAATAAREVAAFIFGKPL
jgi:hypothetical protein